jgi:TolA-binding protein
MKTIGPVWKFFLCGFAMVAAAAALSNVSLADEPREQPREKPREEVRQRAAGEGDRAAEAAKIQERLRQLEAEAKELKEAGKADAFEAKVKEYQELRRKLEALRGGGERDTPRQPELSAEVREKLENLRKEIAKLREAGEREKAAQLEQQARELLSRAGVSPGPSGPQAKMQHLRAAVEHLRAAGLNDLAEEVIAHARKLEQEVGADRPPRRESAEPRKEGEREPARDKAPEKKPERD